MVSLRMLLDSLDYDSETGILKWKDSRPRNHFGSDRSWRCYLSRNAGKVAGAKMKGGYIALCICGKRILAHRVAYAIHFNIEWDDLPSQIDHKNRITNDNRISNLRAATHGQNMHNRGINANNTAGLKGVSWKKQNFRWVANIVVGGKKKHLGYFDSKEKAHAAYVSAANTNFGNFARAA